MKFSCERTSFTQAVTITGKAIANKPSAPVLSGIYIKAEADNTLELRATDNETSIICKLTAKEGLNVETPGEAVLAGRYFQEIVRNLPGENVNIDYNYQEKTIKIQSGSLKYTLLSMNAEDYPQIIPFQGDVNFVLSDKVLRNLIMKTCYACSNDTARPIFTGCSLNIHENTIAMAATNTHQLAVQNATLNSTYDGNLSSTIPSKVLSAIEKMLVSDVPTDVNISLNSRQIGFAYDNMYVATRLIEGRFPDYSRVIPLDFATRVIMDKSEFASALRRINVIASTSEYKSVKFEFMNSSVRMSASNPDIGYSEEILPASIDGEDLVISFNSEYLLKVLAVMETPQFIFSLNNSVSAAAIREVDSTDFTYIITPIRTTA